MNYNEISFNVFFQHEMKLVHTYTNSYRNLMYLLADQFFLDDFGDCKGMGKCGTCAIEIMDAPNLDMNLQRNERKTLQNIITTELPMRLSCQLFINSNLQNAIIKIIESD
ncbi:2Fe-2S iron-sulfur cluster-binding protein [Hydrotalea sp.]|uniref:2Fe-2S iron-sulfur cluster-binding protein n=1 Tax=Hydrotalea sp. TaxID=2881279 RepID=UPI003D0B84BE